MKEYLKMADVFGIGVSVRYKAPRLIECGGVLAANCPCEQSAEYTAHAINSHDELVSEVEHLTSSLKHANSNHELFERQYYLEKDKHELLQMEVERLCEIIMLTIETNESMASVVPATDWGSGFKECATATSKALMETASKHSPQWVAYQMAKRGK